MSNDDRYVHPKPEDGKNAEPYIDDIAPGHKATIGDYLRTLAAKNSYQSNTQTGYSNDNGYPEASIHNKEKVIPSVDKASDTFTGNLVNKDQTAVENLDNLSRSQPQNIVDSKEFIESVNKKDFINNVAQERQKTNFQSNLLTMKTRFSDLEPANIDNYEGVPVNENGHPLDIAASLMLGAAGDRRVLNPNPNIERIEKFEKDAIKNNAKIPVNYLLGGGLSNQDATAESFVPAGTGRVKFENIKAKNAASRNHPDFKFIELTKHSFGNMNSYLEPFSDDVGQRLVGPMLRQSIVTLIGCLVQSLKIALICEGLLIAKRLALKLGGVSSKQIYDGKSYEKGVSKFQGGAGQTLAFGSGGGVLSGIGDILKTIIANFPSQVLKFLNINAPFYITKNALTTAKPLDDLIVFTTSVIRGFTRMLIATIRDIGGSAGFFNSIYRSVLRSELEFGFGNSEEKNKLISYFKKLRDSKILGFIRVLSNLGDISYNARDLYNTGKTEYTKFYETSPRAFFGNAYTNAKHSGGRDSERGRNMLSDAKMPNLLIQNVLSEYNIDSLNLTTYRGDPIENTQMPNNSDINFGDFNTKPYFDSKYIQFMETMLEAELVPFYFHDTRTNEIISFNAFLNSLSDSYSANFNSQKGFGRIEGTQVYSDTTRSISIDFTIVPYNSEDMNSMYTKINKLTSLVYPQWSKGTRVVTETGDNESTVYTQPFSQVPTATPLVRMRIGDLIKNNYSRKILAKLHGSEDAGLITVVDGKITKTPIYEDVYETTTAAWKAATDVSVDILKTKAENSGMERGGQELYDFVVAESGASFNVIQSLGVDRFVAIGAGGTAISPNITLSVNSKLFFTDTKSLMYVGLGRGVGADFVETKYHGSLGQILGKFGSLRVDTEVPKFTGKSSVTIENYRVLDNLGVIGFDNPQPTALIYYDIVINTGLENFWTPTMEAFQSGLAPGGIWDVNQYNNRQTVDEMLGFCTTKRFLLVTDGDSEFDKLVLGKSYVTKTAKVKKKAGEVEVGETVETEKITQYQESVEGFKKIFNDQNPLVKSFESTMTEGLAGVITSLTFDWQINTAPWATEAGQTAPMMCKVGVSYAPIHDIAPGLDHNGMNRAPIYRVGDYANSLNGRIPNPTRNYLGPRRNLAALQTVDEAGSSEEESKKASDVTQIDKTIESVNKLN